MAKIWRIVPVFILFISVIPSLHAQPELYSWMRNTTGAIGYGGVRADVDSVVYSDNYVYVRASGIPSYAIGPWRGDPNIPSDQQYLLKFPRNPVAATNNHAKTPLGAIGLFVNGVPIYNAQDANSFNNAGVWHSNAVVVEASSFDAANGHAAEGGRYHHHQNPVKLYVDDSAKHSPIFGFAFDGYPVYGPRGYKNADGTGGIVRMTSSYRLKSETTRQDGPDVDTQYPAGYFVEDFEYVQGLGTLDEYNGRFAVTPEYPNGTYAYYVTIDSTGVSAYPYIVGPRYYGVPESDDFMTEQVTISEPVVRYDGESNGVTQNSSKVPKQFELFQNYPNPFNPTTTLEFTLQKDGMTTLKIYNSLGQEVATLVNEKLKAGEYHKAIFNGQRIASGIYFARLQSSGKQLIKKMLMIK